MKVHTDEIVLFSDGGFSAFNVTERVRSVVRESGVREGMALVYYRHTTGAVLVIEHESGILADLEDVLERIVPAAFEYLHHRRGADANGHAHIRTALLSVSVTLPVREGDLDIGTYQEVVVVDMEERSRPSRLTVQVMGI
jgi:secondary thiamine-phosphate synthase enzyme